MSEFSSYEEQLAEHGKIIYTNVGTSMMPLLREHRDVMIIERPTGRLKKYDVPLYKTPSGKYILHRILKVRENDYVICGDHCTRREYGITDEHIIGVLTGVIRDGKTIRMDDFSYKLYYHLWCDLFYIRVAILKVKSFFVRGFRFLKKKLKRQK
ncbi:MAG: S24/S26 family peptidase [Clostridia bacterium]|nr:S24/S26 family peptidase [Clostridia bacterium]